MYFPSQKMLDLVQCEKVGVWAESYGEDTDSALIIKVPSSVIKAFAQGCKIELIIGVVQENEENSYFTIGVKIFDSQDRPFIAVMAPRFPEENEGILKLINNKTFEISIFDEIDHPVCSAEGAISNKVLDFKNESLNESAKLKLPSKTELANQLLDSFCFEIAPEYGTARFYDTKILTEEIAVQNISTVRLISHEIESTLNYDISGKGEGLTQEKQIDHFLNIVFKKDVYHSPEVTIGLKKRELTDVLTVKGNQFFLIESKAASVNEAGFNEGIERKTARVIKQAKKAVNQLEGAMKAIRRKELICDSHGSEIAIPSEGILHGIVLVSEFLPSENWGVVVTRINEIHSSTQGMVHVVDLSEFIYILKITQNSKIGFGEGMVKRFNLLIENGSLNIKSIDSSLPHVEAS